MKTNQARKCQSAIDKMIPAPEDEYPLNEVFSENRVAQRPPLQLAGSAGSPSVGQHRFQLRSARAPLHPRFLRVPYHNLANLFSGCNHTSGAVPEAAHLHTPSCGGYSLYWRHCFQHGGLRIPSRSAGWLFVERSALYQFRTKPLELKIITQGVLYTGVLLRPPS